MTQHLSAEDHPFQPSADSRATASAGQLLNAIFEQSAVGVALVNAETTRIVEANRRFGEILGVQLVDLMATPFSAIIPLEDVSTALDLVEALKVGRIRTFSLELRRPTTYGSHPWVSLVASALCDSGELPSAYLVLLERITEHKNESDLRRRLYYFESILDRTSDAIFVKDLQGRYLLCNAAAGRFVGKDPKTVLGKDDTVCFPPDEAKSLMERDRVTITGGEIITVEDSLTTVDGVCRTFLATKGPFVDTEGKVVGLFGISRDITDRKLAEAALVQSEERFRNVFEHAGTGIAITDLGGRFLRCNPAYLMLLGYTEEELGGMVFNDIVHPDDHAANQNQLDRLFTQEVSFFQMDILYKHKDGRSVWVNEYVSVLRDDRGKPQNVIALVTDITERIRGQELLEQRVAERTTELGESEARFHAIFEQAAVGVAQVDIATGRFMRVNQRYCDIMRMKENHLLMATFTETIHPEDRPSASDHLRALSEGRVGEFSIEQRCVCGDSAEILVYVTGSLLHELDQPASSSIVIMQDITSKKQVEEALRASEAKFRALSEEAVTAIFVYQSNRFLYANPAAVAISGYTLEELQAIPLWEIAHPDFQDEAKARLAAVERGDQVPSHLEIPILRKDGETRWLDFTAATILIDGQPARIGSAYDITERRCAEARERARLERVIRLQAGQLKLDRLAREDLAQDLRTIVQVTAETIEVERVGLWLFNSDRSALVCRELYQRSLGTYGTESELEVSRYPVYFAALERRLSVGAASAVSDEVTREFAEHYLRPRGIASMLDAPVRRAGQMVGVLCCEHVGEQRVWSTEETSFVASVTDHIALSFSAEDRRMATEALRASEARFALAAQGANDGLWDWNMATDEAYLSPRWKHLLGFEDNEIPNYAESLFSRLHPEDRHCAEEALRGHLERRAPYDLEFRLQCKDGSYRWFRSRGQAQWDEAGQSFRMAGSITDTTDRRQAFDALSDAYRSLQSMSREVQVAQERERTRLSRELHDEFGQLLGALKFDLSRLAESRSGKANPSATARIVGKTALGTVDRLLASLREMVQGLRPAVLEELGLVAAIESLAADIQERSKLRCRIITEPGVCGAVCSVELEGALYRMIQELLMNVVRHARAKSVTLTLRRVEEWVRLTVQDDGRGFRVDAGLRKGRHGLQGIRERAELLGGTIDVQSLSGKGTCVTVAIPIDSAQPDRKSTSRQRQARAGKKARRGT